VLPLLSDEKGAQGVQQQAGGRKEEDWLGALGVKKEASGVG
jgi:hypothetical protein